MRQDKKLHLFIGFVICFFVSTITTWYDMENPNLLLGCFWGYGISMVITILKEVIWDELLGKGVFSWKDIYFGLYGAIAGVVVNIGIYYLSI